MVGLAMILHTSITALEVMPLDDVLEYNDIVEKIIAENNKPKPGGK